MDKKGFYKIQSEAFWDYASKSPDKENFLSLFNAWAISKNIYGIDRHQIWLKVRESRPSKTIILKVDSEEYRRVRQVVDILHKEDLLFLENLINKSASKI